MKRLRTYINNGGGRDSEQLSEKHRKAECTTQRRHPHSATATQEEPFKFPSPQSHSHPAATGSHISFNQLPLGSAIDSNPIMTPQSPRISPGDIASSPKASLYGLARSNRNRKPPPRYSGGNHGGSVGISSPRIERMTRSTSSASGVSVASNASGTSSPAPRLPSALVSPSQSSQIGRYSRSKSVRIVVPDDAVFGTFARPISSPDARRSSGRLGFGGNESNSSRQSVGAFIAIPPPLEAVLEHSEDSVGFELGYRHGDVLGRDDHEHANNILTSSFSDSEADDNDAEDDGNGGDDSDTVERLDRNSGTVAIQTQGVRNSLNANELDRPSSSPEIFFTGSGAASSGSRSLAVSWISNDLNQNDYWAPLHHRSRDSPSAKQFETSTPDEPRSNPILDIDADTTKRSVGSSTDAGEEYLYTPNPTLDTTSAALEELAPQTRSGTPENRHSHPKTHPQTSSNLPRNGMLSVMPNRSYTPLLPGMSSVINFEGTEFLVTVESLLEGSAGHIKNRNSRPVDVRARIVGGGSQWRERLCPGAYVVMFIEGEECLVKVVKELKVELTQDQTQMSLPHSPINPSSPASDTSDSDDHDANPHYMSWCSGMHITVTLARDTFLVVQIERLGLLPIGSSTLSYTTKDETENAAGGLDTSAVYDDDDSSRAQIAGINEQWWTLPENGSHIVLILKRKKRRREYLVRVVRRLTTTGLAQAPPSLNDGSQDKRISEPPGSEIAYEAISPGQHSGTRILQSEHVQASQIRRSSFPSSFRTPTTFSFASPPPSSTAPAMNSDVLILARGYRYLTGSSDGSGGLRFELLLEDRINDLYASYMVPSTDIADGRRQSLTWLVSGGQSHRDASWVFKKDGKPLSSIQDDRLSRNSRTDGAVGECRSGNATADLPHQFVFEKQAPNDAWVFKPAFADQVVSTYFPLSPPPKSNAPPDLDELLSNEGSTFRKRMDLTIFVSRLVLRKDRDMVVFHLSPASKEQVRELSRRVKKKREEAEVKQRTEPVHEAQADIPPKGTDINEAVPEYPMLAKAEENRLQAVSVEPVESESAKTTIASLSQTGARQEPPLRILRYGQRGELIFVPWDTSRLHNTTLQVESKVSPQSPSVKFEGPPCKTSTSKYIVYGKIVSQNDNVQPKQYTFYPVDHDDIRRDSTSFPDLPSPSLPLPRFSFQTSQEDGAWIFASIDETCHRNEPSSTVPPTDTGNKALTGILFRASMDDAGKITLHQMEIKSSLIRSTLRPPTSCDIPQPAHSLHSPKVSVGSVKSESNVVKRKRRRPLSDSLSMKGFKLSTFNDNIRGTLKSFISENRPTSVEVCSKSDLRRGRNLSAAL
ncbi:hypothetical protein F5050DRAFT_1754498 [Lentinula boryana]|uniref:Uncharacterized protein n=1 Tax=Lentinula boryana TaxID=40481 RepID=A0ABQ8QF48_9AGAR|nr:hypothetical protein F5050DRAFT_1754498 [Lentinula boryana]